MTVRIQPGTPGCEDSRIHPSGCRRSVLPAKGGSSAKGRTAQAATPVGIPQESIDTRHVLLFFGALEWIFGSGTHGHSFLSFGNSRGRFAQTCMSHTQISMQVRLLKSTWRDLLKLAPKVLRRALVGRARGGDIAGALLTQP